MLSEAIREDFPILAIRVHGKPLAYLDNAATTQKPRRVLEAIERFYTEHNGNIHRGAHFLSERATESYEAARGAVARFINAADPGEIVFTGGTTDAINLLARSLGDAGFGRGDEIVVTEMEHHSNLLPWQALCRRAGGQLTIVPFDDDGRLRIETLDELLTPRTRLVACALASNALGVVHPVKDIIAAAHARGAPVLIDAAQAVQHMAVDVTDLDCDFLAFSGHKMYAGDGIGVLYGKRERLERLPPADVGGGMVDSVDCHQAIYAAVPHRFEAGTPPVAGAVSLDVAISYIESIGLEAIERHERAVMEYALERLADVDRVRIFARGAPRRGAVSFGVAGVDDYDVGLVLDKLGVAVRTGTHCAEPTMRHFGVAGMIRASFALYTTPAEIDQMIDGLRRAIRMLA
jgi:cysteine desulfurase/selenocysteine lyase